MALFIGVGASSIAAQGSATFTETTFVNNFPDGLTFNSTATLTDGEIVRAELIYGVRRIIGTDSRTRDAVEVTPGQTVALEYLLDTEGQTVTPSTPYFFQWRVFDADGNAYESAETEVRYDDSRYQWDIIENEQVSVWTHDRNASLGEEAFAIANEALLRQRPLFGEDLTFPLHIIVYNNKDEFADWHSVRRDWVGGEAFNDLGITTQIVSGLGTSSWLEDVVPHEISHLYYHQVAHDPRSPTPVWLNEGVAQYNEFHGHESSLNRAANAAENGSLLLLTALENGFGGSEDRIRFSYDVAVSAVAYMVDAYGEAAVAQLLQAYGAGMPQDAAFELAFGRNFDQFQRDWITWLGASPDQYPTPTPIPLPTFPPTPTQMVFATKVPDENGAVVSAENTPTPPPPAATPAAVADAEPTAPPTAPPTSIDPGAGSSGLCGSLALIAPLMLISAIPLWRRKRQ